MVGMEDVMGDPDTEQALAEFDFLVSEKNDGSREARSQGSGDAADWGRFFVFCRAI